MQISPLQLSAIWIGKVLVEPALESFVPVAQITVETTPSFRRNNDDPRAWHLDQHATKRPLMRDLSK
jgi:hypothetical protein